MNFVTLELSDLRVLYLSDIRHLELCVLWIDGLVLPQGSCTCDLRDPGSVLRTLNLYKDMDSGLL